MRNGLFFAAALASLVVFSASAFAATPPAKGMFEGNCAYGLTMGKVVPTDCSVTWTDPASKNTYCFLNEQNKSEFAKNTSMNESKANAEFAKISSLKSAETAQKSALDQASTAIKQANQAVDQAKTLQAVPH